MNMLKQGKNTQIKSKLCCAIWTHIWIPVLQEEDLQPSVKRGTNRTRALVSLYLLS